MEPSSLFACRHQTGAFIMWQCALTVA